jgi:hypothetical protein
MFTSFRISDSMFVRQVPIAPNSEFQIAFSALEQEYG